MIDSRTYEAIEASDTDELLRIVDGHCKSRNWEALEQLRIRCQEAITRGKQLWGVDEHVRYRLALEGPPERAADVLAEGRARFSLGPLPEVAASHKTWAEMDPHLDHGPERLTFASERILRGDRVDQTVDLPELQDWEPEYALPTYKSDRIETPSPNPPETNAVDLPSEFSLFDDPESEHALNELVDPWITQSNGRSQTSTVAGTALHAIAALGLRHAHVGLLEPDQALAHMAWAAASGGAHGNRRGAAAGRYLAWWTVASLADIEWPASAEEIGNALHQMEWYWFDDDSPPEGWSLRLAVGNPELGLSWAVSAGDLAD